MDEVERLCDRMAVLVDGRLIDSDIPAGPVARRWDLGAVSRAGIVNLTGLPGLRRVSRMDGLVEVRGSGRTLTALGHFRAPAERQDRLITEEERT
jgi:hypothetical protein